MSTHVSYQGEHLGRIKPDEHYKIYFIAESFESLEKLLRLSDEDMVEVEGFADMTYKRFKETQLDNVVGYFITLDEFLFKNYRGHTEEEVQKELEERDRKKP